MNCPKCGQTYQQEDIFCGNCGSKLNHDTAEIQSSEATNKETLDKQIIDSTAHPANANVQDINNHQNINPSVVNQNDTHQHIEESFETVQKNENDIFNELKRFFVSAFTRPEQVIKNEQIFSFKVLLILIVVGLVATGVFMITLIPDQLNVFEMSKTNIGFKLIMSLAMILVVHIGITYAVVRLTIIPEIKFNKVLSDYVLVNTFTVALLLVSIMLLTLNSFKFAALILIVMYLFLTITPAYLLSKYGTLYQARISSVYSILILIFTLSLIALIFGESVIETVIMQNLSQLFGRVI